MFCRNCGYEQDGGRFCDRCGQPIYKPRDEGNLPPAGSYNNYYDNSYDAYADEPTSAADQYDNGGYRDSYNNGYNESYYDNGYQEPYHDNAPRQNVYRPDTDAGSRKQPASSSAAEKKSNAIIIVICIGICAVGIFLIWTVFKLITGKDTNGDGSFVTTAPAITINTAKPAVTQAPAETTTPEKKSETKNIEILSAAKVAGMDISDILDTIGDDYRVSWNEYELSDGSYICGVTSDSYFPGVLISYPDEDFGDEDDLLGLFENGEEEGKIVYAVDGAEIGDGVKVGNSYSYIITKANCLGAVDPDSDTAPTIISGRLCYLQFDGDDDIYAIAKKYGSEVADATNTDYKCTMAIFSDEFSFGESIEGTVTANTVALRVAPYADSADMWNINTGEKIKVSKKDLIIKSDNSTWYRVFEYRPDNGVWKHGYIHAEYVKLSE